MAVRNMTEAGNDRSGNKAYIFQESIGAAGTSEAVRVPLGISQVSFTLGVTGGGSGSIQATTDSDADIIAGNAYWVTWDAGTVSVDTQDVSAPITGVRFVCAVASIKVSMLAV